MPQIKVIHNNFLLLIGARNPEDRNEGSTAKSSNWLLDSVNSFVNTTAEYIKEKTGRTSADDKNTVKKEKSDSTSTKKNETNANKSNGITIETPKRTGQRLLKQTVTNSGNKNESSLQQNSEQVSDKKTEDIAPKKQNNESVTNSKGSSSGSINTADTTSNTNNINSGQGGYSPLPSNYGDNYTDNFYLNNYKSTDYDSSKGAFLTEKNNNQLETVKGEPKTFKIDPDKQEDIKKIKEELKKKVPLLNLNNVKISNKKPLFIKSYSAHHFLNPYIRCYIVIKNFNDEFSFRENLETTFFDIPYNMIESFSIEYASQSAINGNFRLTVSDTSGVIGNIFTAMLYSLGYNADLINGVPKINIEFGWSTKGLKRLPKREKNRMLTKNFFSEFLVIGIDMNYDQKFKQEIVISGRQEKTSISALLDDPNSKITPYALLGQYPTEALKMLVYHNVLRNASISKVDNQKFIDDVFKPNKNNAKELSKQHNDAINEFKTCSFNPNFFGKKIKEDQKKLLSDFRPQIATLIQPNTFFNSFTFNNTKNIEKILAIKSQNLTNIQSQSYFSPFLLFSFMLNMYINEVIKEEAELSSYILSFVDFTNVKWGISTPGTTKISQIDTFETLCSYEYNASINRLNSKQESFLNSNNFKLSPKDTWGEVLELLISKIFISETNPPERLFMVHNKYTSQNINSDPTKERTYTEFDDLKAKGRLNYSLRSKDTLLQHIDLVVESLEKNKDNSKKNNNDVIVKSLKAEKTKIEEFIATNTDFIFFVISPGASFVTEKNLQSFLILQQYTVFPKINSSKNLSYQNFNSGKKRLRDESFPDVISFQPKINFLNTIADHINHVSDIELSTGFLKAAESTISIKFDKENESKKTLKELIEEINKILKTDADSTLKITLNTEGYYQINDFTSATVNSENLKLINEYITKHTISKLTQKQKKDFNSDDYKEIVTRFENLKNEIEQKRKKIAYGYHFDKLNTIFKKSLNALPSDNFSSEFYNYQDLSNRYNLELAQSAGNFDAELKILGEPAFTFDFLPIGFILIKVNNFDGTLNEFLSGIYRIVKMKHEIEKGNFFTTLSLQYVLESYRGDKGKIKNG